MKDTLLLLHVQHDWYYIFTLGRESFDGLEGFTIQAQGTRAEIMERLEHLRLTRRLDDQPQPGRYVPPHRRAGDLL